MRVSFEGALKFELDGREASLSSRGDSWGDVGRCGGGRLIRIENFTKNVAKLRSLKMAATSVETSSCSKFQVT